MLDKLNPKTAGTDSPLKLYELKFKLVNCDVLDDGFGNWMKLSKVLPVKYFAKSSFDDIIASPVVNIVSPLAFNLM
jgi:hypothetical protein